MKQLHDYTMLMEEINHKDTVLLYVMTTGCSVCHADFPKVQAIAFQQKLEAVYILADEIPEAAGQLSLFTSPVVILYKKGKEFHRQARIINFNELTLRIEELLQFQGYEAQ